ncbi:preprotein translocase subunit YajC [Pontibacter sp. SGAir0037]|uniref:preprotein translocase subunit YajC n=1 Tax=Pontibacter sp. SGAir0037 TaxID=2571030 RepID=UPI0010CCEC28|nr:preprotein translocase subunit YajC [Pontibacter sp. SGAir0037]QCR24083.1 preprotein translocase subunit YajC [Pontibacter sp. SGAir0037]
MQTILLQASGGPGIQNLILIGAIGIIFYFFMIRPQQKKVRDQKKFREELTKGMQVVTIGGLHGRLVAIEADTVVVEVDKGVRLTFDKSAISLEATSKVQPTNS